MSDDKETITLSRDQFIEWVRDFEEWTGQNPGMSFDSLKAHVEKASLPKRRRFNLQSDGNGYVTGVQIAGETGSTPQGAAIYAVGVFPDDIGPMTKDELRAQLETAWDESGGKAMYGTGWLSRLFKALGLGE